MDSPWIKASSASNLKLISAKYSVKLKPKTPIHVWSGIDAVTGINAFIHNNNLYVTSDKDFDKLLADELTKIASLEPEKVFKEVFEKLLNYGVLKPIPIKTKITGWRSVIKLIHNDIIPGSELKGYIRTAIIRYLLESIATKNIQELVDKLEKGVDLYKKPPRVSEGLEGSLLRTGRLRKQGGFVDALELVLVSDPLIENPSLSVRSLFVFDKSNIENPIASVYAIVLDKAEKINFNVVVMNPDLGSKKIFPRIRAKDSEIHELQEVSKKMIDLKNSFVKILSNPNTFIEILRIHGCRIIDLELRKLPQSPKLEEYRELLNDIKNQLCVEKKECVPARIGYMTGHEAKTVLDIVEQHDKSLHKSIINYMSQQLGHTWDSLTLKLVDFDNKLMGIGWCELCIEHSE